MLTILISLTICDPAAEPLLTFDGDLLKAPTVAPIAKGLPDPRRAPEDGEFCELDGNRRTVGTYLPTPLDGEVLRRLRMLDRLPGVFQVQLDRVVSVAETQCSGRLDVMAAECKAKQIIDEVTREEGATTLDLVLVSLGGFVAGIVAGALAVLVAK